MFDLEVKTTWLQHKNIEHSWYLVDAKDQILGRLASRVAELLIGKSKVLRVPNMDSGDNVVIINAEKIKVTGKKMSDKKYYRHSGYPSGLREETLSQLLSRRPGDVLKKAIRNMLPKNKLRADRMARLHVYAGSEHPHEAQKPVAVDIRS